MKTVFKFFLAAAALSVSCSEDEDREIGMIGYVWDYVNYSVDFEVVDRTTGANLLDPAAEGNILGQPIRVVYNGETYDRITADDLQYDPPYRSQASFEATRVNPPKPLALRWGADDAGCYLLAFGEWTRWDFAGVRFTIDWGDGTRNEIEVGERGKLPDGSRSLDFYAIVDGRESVAKPYPYVRIER